MPRRFPRFTALVAAFATFVFVMSNVASAQDIPANLTWTQLSPATSPPQRGAPAMAYDPVTRKIVLFGGYGSTNYLNDTWTFDGTTWAEVNNAVVPPVRAAAAFAFDRMTRKLVLFGGYDGNNNLGDT